MKWIFLMLFSSAVASVEASTLCVGPSATGSGSGADWSNLKAWSGTPTRGDTWYLRDGSFTGKTMSVATSGATLITIRKPTVADHVTATGWSDSFTNQSTFSGEINFTTSNWLFDGITGGGPANNWTNGFGFKITEVNDTSAVISVGNGSTANNVTVRHVDMQGITASGNAGGSISNDGIAIYGDTGITLSYAWMHGLGRCPVFFSGGAGFFEYIYVQSYNYFGSGGVHSEVMSASQGAMGDTTWRYCLITMIQSTGGLMWDNSAQTSSSFFVYGSIFYKPSGATWETANGVIGGWTGGSGEEMHNVHVYNNTFINIDQESLSSLPNTVSGCDAKNNLWYNSVSPGFSKFPTHDYNHYINSGGSHSEANGTSASSGNPFTDFVNLDFTLTGNTTAGTALGSPYDVDGLGVTRTTWSRGAFEFSGGDTTPPTVTSATVNAAGTSLTLAMSETSSIGAGGNGGLTISMSGGAVTATYASGSGSSALVYTLSRTITIGETGTHSYTQPGNGIEDTAGNDLVTYSGATVTNNSTASGGGATANPITTSGAVSTSGGVRLGL